MEIIWTKEELNKIRRIILNIANLTLDEHNELVVNNLSREYEMQKLKSKGACYSIDKEIKTLFYYQDREEIKRILDMTGGISFNPNDPDHLGLVATISKIDADDYAQIFTILREIAGQFEKIAAKTAYVIRSYANTTDEFKTEITKFKNSQDVTLEEMLANSKMNVILNSTNGIAQHELFKDLIERYYGNMKHLIILHLEATLAHENKENIKRQRTDVNQYQKSFGDKFMRTLKKKNAVIFRK